MKLKDAVLTSSLLSIAEASDGHFHHPGLRYVRFVFCDDKPNENNLGVEYEDFDAVAQSAIGTPIKMRFLGTTVGAHVGSIPVGHITDMTKHTTEDGTNQLIADGVLYASDYPDEVDYLEEAFANKQAPGVSFEIRYDSAASKIKEGITWIKGVLTQAATFVRNPAYGTRTALLALASNNSLTDEDFAAGLTAIAQELRPKNTNKGGNNKVEEELKKAKEALEAAQKELAEANTKITQLEADNGTLTTAKAELENKVKEHETALAEVAKEKLIATRTAAVAETGIPLETDAAKLAKKQEFWVHLDEEAFAEYVDDIKAAAKAAPKTSHALASASRTTPPRLQVQPDGPVNLADLKNRLGSLSRTSISEEE